MTVSIRRDGTPRKARTDYSRKALTKEEKIFMFQNYKTQTIKQLADALGRSYGTVCSFLRLHNLESYKPQSWSEQEIKALLDCFGDNDNSIVGQIVGRSASACVGKARQLGLEKSIRYLHETYQKLAFERNKHYHPCPPLKPVVQLSLTGEYIRSFDSVKEAGETVHRKACCISRVCKGKGKTVARCKWMYKVDYEKLINNNNGN